MTDTTPAFLRALVAAALILATTTLMVVAVSTARAAGALAVGKCGAYGQAFDHSDAVQARQSALAQCRGGECRVVAEVARGCAALAIDMIDPCSARGWARATQLGGAQNEALKACYDGGGKDCVIRTFLCDSKG